MGFSDGTGRGGRQGRGGGFGGGRRGVLARGELQGLLLSLIAKEPRHGYDLIRAIEQLSGGVYAPSPGVVYPALAILEDIGHVASDAQEGGRKAFTITPAGEAELAANATVVAAIEARLAALSSQDWEQLAPVRRAMGNLKIVLGSARGDLDRDKAHAIAALIDEAAQKIERLG